MSRRSPLGNIVGTREPGHLDVLLKAAWHAIGFPWAHQGDHGVPDGIDRRLISGKSTLGELFKTCWFRRALGQSFHQALLIWKQDSIECENGSGGEENHLDGSPSL